MELIEVKTLNMEALEDQKQRASEEVQSRLSQKVKVQRVEFEPEAIDDITEKSSSNGHYNSNFEGQENQIPSGGAESPLSSKFSQVDKDQELMQNIIKLHKAHDDLKQNRRDRKKLLKDYKELQLKFPAFNTDPLEDSE